MLRLLKRLLPALLIAVGPGIGSAGSILSICSAGSILSVGSAGSILSFMSGGSILSALSISSRLSFLRWRAVGNQAVSDLLQD